jgi:ABC-type lipoprotein release transport system permease subunit
VKVRHLCAIIGVAVAAGSVVFMNSLVATNDRQSVAVAERILSEVKVAPDAMISRMTLDFRPGGRVMQGPPLSVTMATDKNIATGGVVVTKALFAQRRLAVPPIGTELVFVGSKGAHRLKLAGVIDWQRPLRGYPNAFVNPAMQTHIAEASSAWEPKTAEELSPGFMSDSQRNFNRARALLLWAAALSALCLLLNSLYLSIEARRKELALLRVVGMTRGGVAAIVVREAFILTFAGLMAGIAVAALSLWVYVRCDSAAYPMGLAFAWNSIRITILASLPVVLLAIAISLKSAFAVRPLEAASNRTPRKKQLGMLIAFACGFGAFVAVEVWGASLMSAFVPSKEWPHAIVSILPGGVSSFDIEKLQGQVKGVRRIHELQPLQVNILPLEEMKGGGRGGNRRQYRNALLLASDWLPDFKFSSGDRATAEKAIHSGDNCIITEMMARARKLRVGDELLLDLTRGQTMALKVAGIVDLNWHMVTSRGLVRGLNRMPVNTDGPVFVSFDTLAACDLRPQHYVKMTHLWLDYEREFLKSNGVFSAGRIVEKEIVKALGLLETEVYDNTVRLHARDEIADGTLAHGTNIIGSMARVPFIFIAVISLGFIAMLIASADSRKREFAVLRAVGATHFQLAAILAKEAIKVAALAIALGLPGGALVGWLFTAATRSAMGNWGLPPAFAVPWAVILEGAIGAMFFALAVAIPTALFVLRSRR